MINNEKNVLLYIIFLAYPFLPKIGFFGQYIYVQELLFLVLILSIKSFKINNSYRFIYILNILLICYIFFIIICNNFDINLNIIKYLKQLFLFFILIPLSNIKNIELDKLIKCIILTWTGIFLINLLLIILNYIVNRPELINYLYDYTPTLRVIGLTGSGISFAEGFRNSYFGNELGTTSISVSILIALILCIVALSDYKYKLILGLILFVELLFTFSRSGLVIIFIAYLISLINTEYKKYRIFFTKIGFFSFLLIITFGIEIVGGMNKFNIFDSNSTSTIEIRSEYWGKFFSYVINQPFESIFGIALFNKNTSDIIGTDYAESLLFDLFLNFGLIGILYFIFIFYFLYKRIMTKNYDLKYINIRKSLLIFMPGFIFVNIVSGSSLLTDFLLPFFLLLIVSIKKS